MLAVSAMLVYARIRCPDTVPNWLVCEVLFMCMGFSLFVWDQVWRRGELPAKLRAPVVSANVLRVILLAYLLAAFVVTFRLAAVYRTGPDSWLFRAMPWLFAAPVPLLAWFTFQQWKNFTGKRHSVWNVVFLCGALAGMLYSSLG